MKEGSLVQLGSHYQGSVYDSEKGLRQKMYQKGASGIVVSCEVRGPTPGANVYLSSEKTVVWLPAEFLSIEN